MFMPLVASAGSATAHKAARGVKRQIVRVRSMSVSLCGWGHAGSGSPMGQQPALDDLAGPRLSGLLPLAMQSPLRMSNTHSCLGQVSVQSDSARWGCRSSGAGSGCRRRATSDRCGARTGRGRRLHPLRAADLEALGGHHVVPVARGAHRTGLELGQVQRQDDVDRPDDLGQAQRREGHQQRVQHLGRRAALAQRAPQVLAKPRSVCECTLVMTLIRLRVFGSRWCRRP
jgi:hypothetical protein